MQNWNQLLKNGVRNPHKIPSYILSKLGDSRLLRISPVFKLYLLSKGASLDPKKAYPADNNIGTRVRTLGSVVSLDARATTLLLL